MIYNQNIKVYTQSWQPSDPNRKLKGLVGMIHGYTSESDWIFELNATAMAKVGFYVCALDLQGHGSSDGSPPHHVLNVQPLLQDYRQYFDSSLGGAIAILLYLNQIKNTWKGLILNGPMFTPPTIVFLAPCWRIAITTLPNHSFIENWKRGLVEKSPNRKT
ncbi:hypothetical protein ACJIZ3_005887 [Penstemon smallii]|uniref:Serine aminopeptidase S33 domain-containing protein n=1 Tax=Penstemon smallii TaxID=265156 RepID=A0ABD3S6E4_9LAMI